MSNEVIAALVGAIAGSMGGGLTSWLLLRKQLAAARNWELATVISDILGPILSAYTPDTLKSKDDVFSMQKNWGEKARGLSLLGWEGGGTAEGETSRALNDYFQALIAYVEHKMTRGELEHRRGHCRNLVQEKLKRSILGD